MLQVIHVNHRSQLHSMCADSLNQLRFIFTLTPLPAIRQPVSPALGNAMWSSAFRQCPVYLETCFNFRLHKSLQPNILGHVLCAFFPPLFYKGRFWKHGVLSWEFAIHVFDREGIPSHRPLLSFPVQIWEQEKRIHSIHSFIYLTPFSNVICGWFFAQLLGVQRGKEHRMLWLWDCLCL